MMTGVLHVALEVFSLVVTLFFILWGLAHLAMGVISAGLIWKQVRRRTRRNIALAGQLASAPTVSVIVPAFNEAVTIVESVRALLALDYESREVVVVNDGSSDNTLQLLEETFQLVAAPVAYVQPLKSAPVRGVYRSIREAGLVVIDKQNGGSKSDAINAGINAASGSLVLTVDADTVLEPDALSRAVLPFLEDPRTVALGGNITVANGCRVEHGRVVAVALPRSWWARVQVVEYMRSFLVVRMARASANSLTVIAGAFGLFRRDAVIAVGGYDQTAIGEDMDLTIRLHKYCRQAEPVLRIGFDPFPLCSTQVPEDWASLRTQRCRWRRGLIQVLWRHRRMVFNPRYGWLGMVSLPAVLIFEGLGPLLEMIGYVIATVAAVAGFLNWDHYRLLIVASILFGVAVTLLAVLLSDVAMMRYLRGRDFGLLVAAAILENLGYRQLNSWWACVGTVQAMRKQHGWGTIKRRVFEGEGTPV